MATGLPEIAKRLRPLALAAIGVCGVLASGFFGGSTNAVNGAVSPTYFETVLGWHGVEDVWRASIAQGIFEGLLFGIFFSLVFTVATGIITGASCKFDFAFRHLLGVVAGAYVCWALGGLASIGLATLSPEFYRRTFIGVPQEFGPMTRYAWVGGSIWGAEFGGLMSVVVGLVVLRANWRRQIPSEILSEPVAAQRWLRKKSLYWSLILATGVFALYFFLLNPGADFTAVDFHGEYTDRKAANERYVGKSLSIRGKVLSVDDSWLCPHGWKSVAIGEGPSGVLCHFSTARVYQTCCLFPGQVVVIRGVCKGEFAGLPILSDCKVVGMNLPQTICNLWTGSE